jgi:hypothetical protein
MNLSATSASLGAFRVLSCAIQPLTGFQTA